MGGSHLHSLRHGLGCVFFGFVDVPDAVLIDEHAGASRIVALPIGAAEIAQFDCIPVVPFDDAFHLFAIFQDHYHPGLSLDLFLEIENLRVRTVFMPAGALHGA